MDVSYHYEVRYLLQNKQRGSSSEHHDLQWFLQSSLDDYEPKSLLVRLETLHLCFLNQSPHKSCQCLRNLPILYISWICICQFHDIDVKCWSFWRMLEPCGLVFLFHFQKLQRHFQTQRYERWTCSAHSCLCTWSLKVPLFCCNMLSVLYGGGFAMNSSPEDVKLASSQDMRQIEYLLSKSEILQKTQLENLVIPHQLLEHPCETWNHLGFAIVTPSVTALLSSSLYNLARSFSLAEQQHASLFVSHLLLNTKFPRSW